MALDFVSWMGGAILSTLIMGGAIGYAILGEYTPTEKSPIAMDDDQEWSKLLNKEQ